MIDGPLLRHVAVVAMLSAAVAGCRGEGRTAAPAVDERTVTVAGAGATIVLMKKLIPAFNTRHPDIRVTFFPESHTQAGIDSVLGRKTDIGAIARNISPQEEGVVLTTRYIATDPVVFIVHPSTGITDLTIEQIRAIYSGQVTDWSVLGGRGAVVLIDRPVSTAAWETLSERLFAPPFLAATKRVVIDRSTDTVVAVADTAGAIGYLSYGVAKAAEPRVTLLTVDGVRPSAETVANATYPFIRRLGIAFRRDTPESARILADFLGTETVRQLVIDNGFIP